jgi:hypothetical protein
VSELIQRRGSSETTYNGNAVIVNVGSLVELLLKLSVGSVRLDTARVKGGLVDSVCGKHFAEILGLGLLLRFGTFDLRIGVRRSSANDGVLHCL